MIKVKNMSYTYAGSEQPVLHSLNFEIERGSIFGFLGPSGAGKSTTQKILMGLLEGYSGRILFDRAELDPESSDFYRQIGVAFDVPRFYRKMTGRENLRFFAELYGTPDPDIDGLLESVELLEAADRKVEAYSKGMTVRLNFCRALLHEPRFLFLDEPTSGLDPALARKVRRIIRNQKSLGRTVFLTTHSMETAAELCDRVAFLVDGTIALCDSPAALRESRDRKDVTLTHRGSGSETIRSVRPLRGLHRDPLFLKLMEEESLISIHSRETSLEEIFIEVTGRSLHDGSRLS